MIDEDGSCEFFCNGRTYHVGHQAVLGYRLEMFSVRVLAALSWLASVVIWAFATIAMLSANQGGIALVMSLLMFMGVVLYGRWLWFCPISDVEDWLRFKARRGRLDG